VSTWLDRDLEIAGVAAVQTEQGISQRLVRLRSAVAVIPNAAIHLNRKVNESFQYSRQDHLRCIIGSDGADPRVAADPGAGANTGAGADLTGGSEPPQDRDAASGTKQPESGGRVRRLVAAELGVDPERILGLDLFLADRAEANRIGQAAAGDQRVEEAGDLYVSRHIDNLVGCSTTLDGFLASSAAGHTQIAAFFDNEEIGSRSFSGAQSGMLDRVMERIVLAGGGSVEDAHRFRVRSYLLSNDGAHGAHPNFHDKYDPAYLPRLGGGPVVKSHAGMSYTSVADTTAHFRHACATADVPVQSFANRSDGRSGSTIGPVLQTRSDLRSVDVGIPMLAMHSVRETASVRDLELMTRAIRALYDAGPM
jgi:aspartyl aminopeptidase